MHHQENRGKGRALKTGFKAFLDQSETDYILCIDADLQHPVASIPDFLKKAESGNSFIIGARERSLKSMPVHRILSNMITSYIISLITRQKIKDSQCGYRMIHRDVLNNLDLHENGYQLESEMLLKAAKNGVKIDFIPIPTIYNAEKSHMRNFRDTLKFIRLVFGFLLKRQKIISR
jgi:glycosyltransferase involved in cell wall biosynthesis